MIEKMITVSENKEMDGRRLALMVQTAGAFDSEIYVQSGQRRVNAKSLMGTMALGIVGGGCVTVSADGKDEAEAIEKMTEFLED